jgi:hypothetical protein
MDPSTSFDRQGRTVVAVADTHGHLDLFQELLAKLDRELGNEYLLVTLGDYVDAGLQVRQFLDFLIDLKQRRPERFFPIMGNHDLACLRALGWQQTAPDPAWYAHWQGTYLSDVGPAGATPFQYGASSATQFQACFPQAHFDFLAGLPWFLECTGLFFVHAGLTSEPLEEQREMLRHRQLLPGLKLQPQIRENDMSVVTDHPFPGLVVSGHTKIWKMQSRRTDLPYLPCGCLNHERRITLHSAIEFDGALHYVIFPRFAGHTFGVIGDQHV